MRPVRHVRCTYGMLCTVVIPFGAQMSGANVGHKCQAQMLGANVGRKCWAQMSRFEEYFSNTGSLIEEFSSDVQNFLKQQRALRSAKKQPRQKESLQHLNKQLNQPNQSLN